MKIQQYKLFKIAEQFGKKYAKSKLEESIQKAIAAAAAWQNLGIVNFPKMLEQDKANLAFNVTKKGKQVIVSRVSVSPPELEPKYSQIQQQVQSYLNKFIDLFPINTEDQTLNIEYYGDLGGGARAQY